MKLTRSLLVIILLLSVTFPGKTQTHTLDSLNTVLETSNSQETLITTNLEIAGIFSQLRNDTALYYIEDATTMAVSLGDMELLADTYFNRAEFYRMVKEENEKAFFFACKSRDLMVKVDDQSEKYINASGVAELYGGAYFIDQGEYTKAHASFLKAVSFFEQVDNQRYILQTNNQLMILYAEQDQLDKAEEVLNESIQISIENSWYYDQMTFQSNKGALLNYQDKFVESIESYQAAEKLIYQELDTTDYYSLGLIYTNIGSNYENIGNYDSSYFYHQKGLTYRVKINHARSVITSYSYLCIDCAQLGKLSEAEGYCQLMQTGLDSTEMNQLNVRGVNAWINYYEASNNYKMAFEKMKDLMALKEEIINENNIREQTQQEKDFEFQKERLLSEQKLLLKNEKIALEQGYNSNLKLGLYILGVLLLGLAILFYSNIKQRKIIIEKNKKLNESVEEKETLLKEIHHRVKNNLQLVSSLLGLQSDSIDNEHVHSAFEEGQNRVQAMALIHQKLYQRDVTSKIDFEDYLHGLAGHFNEMNVANKQVDFEIDCEDIELDIDTAIPLGLIVNELFTNSYKHAFKNTKLPKLSVSIRDEGSGEYTMKMSDNGNGLPPDLDWAKTKTLGLRLIRSLVKQLIGKIDYEYQQNLSVFSIRFKSHLGRNLLD